MLRQKLCLHLEMCLLSLWFNINRFFSHSARKPSLCWRGKVEIFQRHPQPAHHLGSAGCLAGWQRGWHCQLSGLVLSIGWLEMLTDCVSFSDKCTTMLSQAKEAKKKKLLFIRHIIFSEISHLQTVQKSADCPFTVSNWHRLPQTANWC